MKHILVKKIYISKFVILLTLCVLVLSLFVNFQEYILKPFQYSVLFSFDTDDENHLELLEEIINELEFMKIPYRIKTENFTKYENNETRQVQVTSILF